MGLSRTAASPVPHGTTVQAASGSRTTNVPPKPRAATSTSPPIHTRCDVPAASGTSIRPGACAWPRTAASTSRGATVAATSKERHTGQPPQPASRASASSASSLVATSTTGIVGPVGDGAAAAGTGRGAAGGGDPWPARPHAVSATTATAAKAPTNVHAAERPGGAVGCAGATTNWPVSARATTTGVVGSVGSGSVIGTSRRKSRSPP